MKTILNVVMLYQNEAEVLTYAKSLISQNISKEISLVIVVNKSSASDLETLSKQLNELNLVTYIYNPQKNLGYLNGAIYGINQFFLGENYLPEWVIISNTDIEYYDNTFFKGISDKRYTEDTWWVAPSVYSPSKKSYDNPLYDNRLAKKKMERLIYIYERPNISFFHMYASKIKSSILKGKKTRGRFI